MPVVRVARPEVREVTDYQYFTGRTEAPESLDLRARVTGYLVQWKFDKDGEPKEYNFTPGDEVKKDQALFKIDPRPYQASYDQAMAQLALAQARLKLAEADVARALNVAKTPGAISQQDLDKYSAQADEASAEVEAAAANSESAKLNLDFTSVTTPIEGIVSRNLLSQGNLVNANDTLLTTVVSQDPMYAYFDVDERTMLRVQQMIREGKFEGVHEAKNVPVDMALGTDGDKFPHVANIDFVNNQVDPTTGTLQVRGVLKNPAVGQGPRMFKPGLFVKVRLPMGPAHQALVIPQASIGTDQGVKFVLVVNQQGIVEYRPILVGDPQPNGMQEAIPQKIVREKDGLRLAKPGEEGVDSLTAEDEIIVGGLQRVRPGEPVKIREETQGEEEAAK